MEMGQLNGAMSPTVQCVIDNIASVIKSTLTNYTKDDMYVRILTSHILGSKTEDMCSFSVSFALSTNPNNSKTLNFFIVQNTKTAEVCLIISSGESEGLRILFRSMNRYPETGIQKYLPNIIKSTISILD